MIKRLAIEYLIIGLFILASVGFGQSGSNIPQVRGTLSPKTTFEPTKISVEDVRYIGDHFITASDTVIMRECASVLRADLDFSPYFQVVTLDSFFMVHMEIKEMTLQAWGWLGSAYVIRLEAEFPGDNLRLRYTLFSTATQKEIRRERFESDRRYYRALAHDLANDVYKTLTGDEGIFRTSIIYVRSKNGSKELYTADYDGYNERPLTNNRSINISPALTPDGQYVYFTSFLEGSAKIFLLTLKDNSVDLIAGYPGINAAPAISPDGKYVACVLSKDGNSEIYLLDRKGKIVKRLTYSWAIESSPTWSPDGKAIAFTSDRTGSPQIYMMDVDGLNVRRLTYDGKYNDSPFWSPRGDRIVLVSRDKVFKICSVDITGQNFQVLAEQGDNENPHFSPDGNNLVFSSNRGGSRDLYEMDVFGHKQHRITLTGDCSNPVWSPYRK